MLSKSTSHNPAHIPRISVLTHFPTQQAHEPYHWRDLTYATICFRSSKEWSKSFLPPTLKKVRRHLTSRIMQSKLLYLSHRHRRKSGFPDEGRSLQSKPRLQRLKSGDKSRQQSRHLSLTRSDYLWKWTRSVIQTLPHSRQILSVALDNDWLTWKKLRLKEACCCVMFALVR